MTTKYCAKCKTTKDIEDFQVRSASKDGRHSWCSLCYNAYRRERNYNNMYRPDNYAKTRRSWDAHRKTIRGRAQVLLRSAKRRADQIDLDFDLDLDWVMERLTPMICEASGLRLSMEVPEHTRNGRFSPSLDRIIPRLGYTKENTQLVSMIYNQAKADSSHEDVLELAKALMKKEKVPSV